MFFLVEVPVVEDVAVEDDVGFRQGLVEEAAADEGDTIGNAVFFDVVFEDGAHFGKVEADSGQLRIDEGDLDGEVALGSAGIDVGSVVFPRKFSCDGGVGSAADAGHGVEEFFQLGGVGVEFGEHVVAGPGFVLLFAGSEGGGEMAPEGIKAVVRHFEDAADVGRLVLVEEEVGLEAVGIDAVVVAGEKAESDEGVEKIAGAAGMEAHSFRECIQVFGMFGEFGEEFHLDGTEEGFGGPEAETGLEDAFGSGGSGVGVHGVLAKVFCGRRGVKGGNQ